MTLSQREFLPCIHQFGKLHCIYGLEYNIEVLYTILVGHVTGTPFSCPCRERGNSL